MSFTVTLLKLPPVAIGTDPSGSMAVAILNAATGGGGGSSSFVGLTDTPSAYTGQGGKGVRVNAGGSALEFFDAATAASVAANTAAITDIDTLLDALGGTVNDQAAAIAALGDADDVLAAAVLAAQSDIAANAAAIAGKAEASDLTAHAAENSGVHGITPFMGAVIAADSAGTARGLIGAAASSTLTNHTGGLTVHGRSSFVASIVGSANAGAFRTAIDAAQATHTHAIAGVTGLQTALDGKAASNLELAEIPATVDGGGSAPTAVTLERMVERATTLTSASLVGDVSGSISVTVKRDRGGVVTTLGTIALSSAKSVRDTTMAGWTTDLMAGDILILEVGAGTTLTRATLTLGRRAA